MLAALVLCLLLVTQTNCADEGVNFAKDKATWQSSTTGDGVSSRAVDGYKNPYFDQNSCIQTTRQYEPWWAVDLEEERYVTSVRITNRADCCWEELANFNIRVGVNLMDGGQHNPQCGPTFKYNVPAGTTHVVKCAPPLLGRYVSVDIRGAGGVLNFCEVEVYGYQRRNVFSVKAVSYGAKDYDDGKLSEIFVDDTFYKNFTLYGHYILPFNMTTGANILQKHFDTLRDAYSSTKMPLFLENLPSEIFVLVIVHSAGYGFYQSSIPVLEALSGDAHISDQMSWGDSWSLLGYKGKLPSPSWRNSVMKNIGYGPAVIEDVIPKLMVPGKPASAVIVDLTSSSFTLKWSRPPGIVVENELPLNYTVCVGENGSQVNDCINNGAAHLYQVSGLGPGTEYNVSVRAQSYAGSGRTAVLLVTTMQQADSRKIQVELVSRILEDVLYRPDGQAYSSIIIRGQQQNFDGNGLHFIVLDPKTGSQVMRDSFDTHHDSESTTNLAQFLSTIPKPSIILMVVYYQAHDYYTGDPLRSLCPNALSSYTSRKSWSMICFYGFGTVPWVTSHTSTGDHGPAVVSIHILLPKELKNAPVLNDVVAKSSQSLELFWTAPQTDNFTGDISYHICYQKSSIPTDDGCYLLSVGGSQTQAVVSGLRPFEEYRVKIRGVAPLGYGPYSNVLMSTTLEAEPSSGPETIEFPHVNSSSIRVTWSPPPEQDRNGFVQQYSVCYRSEEDTDPCSDNATVVTTVHRWYEISGLKPYREIRFEIKAATAVGFGPATVAYQRTSPSAPDGPPTEAHTTHVTARYIMLSWQPPLADLRNGRIINYTICIRVFTTFPGPCVREVWTSNRTNYTATELKPYTKYLFEISAATEVGFGPRALVDNTTLQAEPSAPPKSASVNSFSHNHIGVTWSPPDPSEVNGVLTGYSVCIKTPSDDTCLHGNTVPAIQTSYMFSGLRAYVNYSVEIRASTVKGFGPPAVLFQRTSQTEPSGPPTGKRVIFLNGTTIGFSWSLPEPELRNGPIVYYILCIREYGPEFACSRTTNVSESEENRYTYGGLNPSKEYIIVIKAATVIGLGPPVFIQKTAGECDLPVLHRGGYVSDDSFSASGFLGRNYEPYQARIDNGLPWCDSGTRNESYIQVDFGGLLRILGVATKGHKQHWQSWVSSYHVLYSVDNIDWKYINVSGKTVIAGNTGDGREIQYFLDEPVLTRFVRFQVHGFVGVHPCMGIQVYGCAPTTSPTGTSVIKTEKDYIKVSWNPFLSDSANGEIIGYKVCHKLSSSPTPCATSAYLRHNVTSYTVTGLQPYTDYDIEISAGTQAGYGPPFRLHPKTGQAPPSGPPFTIMAQDITSTTLTLLWTPPEEYLRNGRITLYAICYKESSTETNCGATIKISGTVFEHAVADLRPNTEYIFQIRAATNKGWGPMGAVYETTLPDVPSGPPTSVSVTRVGPNILQVFWQAPEAKKQNGDIIGYRLCIREQRVPTPCRNYVTLPETKMVYSFDELKPYAVYSLHVEAKTALGYGPAHNVDYRTGEAAPSAPPKDVAIRSVTSTSIEITWTPPDEEKRNGIIAMYEVVVYQEMHGSKVEKIASSLLRANATVWKLSELSPRTDYIFHVKAGTSEGFGPAVIIHKRSDGDGAYTSEISGGKLTAGGIAGGSILLIVLIAVIILSILWNKGLLPHTKTRKMMLESQRRRRHRRRRRRRKKRRRRRKEISESEAVGVEIHATESVYSELNDYDAPAQHKRGGRALKYETSEDLYGTAGRDMNRTGVQFPRHEIFAPVTSVQSEDIYGASFVAPGMGIYGNAPPGIDINGNCPLQEVDAKPLVGEGPDMVVQRSNTVLPPIIPRPSILPPVIPLESTLSSIFVKMSATKLNDPEAKNLPEGEITSTSVPLNPSFPSPKDTRKTRSTTSTFAIPQPSKFTPVITKPKISPGIKVDSAASKTNTSPGPTFPPIAIQMYPISSPSNNSHPTTDTAVQSFSRSSMAAASGTDIAGSNVSPVTILRSNTKESVPNYPAPYPSINSHPETPVPHGHESTSHLPNVPRHSIDLTSSTNPSTSPHKSPPIPKHIPEPIVHQPSFPIPSVLNKRHHHA